MSSPRGSPPGTPVYLIGGTAGCGKTTLANQLVARLDLDHRLGTGFVRAIVQSESDATAEPSLFSYTFDGQDPVATMRSQAARLLPAVRACLRRAQAEGTSLVVEGTHLLPDLYASEGVPFVVLDQPPEPVHLRRLNGHRHRARTVGPDDMRRIREIGDHYRLQAHRHGVPTVVYGANLDEIVDLLQQQLPGHGAGA